MSLSLSVSFGSRMEPADVPALQWNGIEIRTIHWGMDAHVKQNGGFVEAVDLKTKKRLWGRRIYVISYKCGMETDVQDIFVTSLRIENEILIVTDELNRSFRVDPMTGTELP